jgi:hypothetical protein
LPLAGLCWAGPERTKNKIKTWGKGVAAASNSNRAENKVVSWGNSQRNGEFTT